MSAWRHSPQRFDAHDGSHSLYRCGDLLYCKRTVDQAFYELSVNPELTYNGTYEVRVVFCDDGFFGISGTLICTNQECTVQFSNGSTMTYSVTNNPQNIGRLFGLHQFDFRQVPAAVYAVHGTSKMVYLSRWKHTDPRDHDKFHQLYLVDLGEVRPTIDNYGRVRCITTRGDNFQSFSVERSPEANLYLFPNGALNTGNWGAATLERVHDLNAFTIVHDPISGELTNFAPKG